MMLAEIEPEMPRDHAQNVGVDERLGSPECEGEHGAGNVRPYAWQRF